MAKFKQATHCKNHMKERHDRFTRKKHTQIANSDRGQKRHPVAKQRGDEALARATTALNDEATSFDRAHRFRNVVDDTGHDRIERRFVPRRTIVLLEPEWLRTSVTA